MLNKFLRKAKYRVLFYVRVCDGVFCLTLWSTNIKIELRQNMTRATCKVVRVFGLTEPKTLGSTYCRQRGNHVESNARCNQDFCRQRQR